LNKLTSANIKSLAGNPVRLHYDETTKFLKIKKGESFAFKANAP